MRKAGIIGALVVTLAMWVAIIWFAYGIIHHIWFAP